MLKAVCHQTSLSVKTVYSNNIIHVSVICIEIVDFGYFALVLSYLFSVVYFVLILFTYANKRGEMRVNDY